MSDMRKIDNKFWSEFDQDIADNLSTDQKNEIDRSLNTLKSVNENSDKADIRLSLGWYYMVIFFGKECRSAQRLVKDREKFPLITTPNMMFFMAVWFTIFVVALSTQIVSL